MSFQWKVFYLFYSFYFQEGAQHMCQLFGGILILFAFKKIHCHEKKLLQKDRHNAQVLQEDSS